jgi:hypothetical protein
MVKRLPILRAAAGNQQANFPALALNFFCINVRQNYASFATLQGIIPHAATINLSRSLTGGLSGQLYTCARPLEAASLKSAYADSTTQLQHRGKRA